MKTFAMIAAAFLVTSCGLNFERSHEDGADPGVGKADSGFARVRAAVFVPHCIGCHRQYGDSAAVKLELGAIARAVNSDRMPKGSAPLPAELKRILNDWIASVSDKNPLPELSPEWNSISQLILVPRCVVCHNPGGQARFLDLSTREAVIGGRDRIFDGDKKLLNVGRPEESYLITVIQDPEEPMPPKNSNIAPLNQQEIKVLTEWIRQNLP